MTHCLDTQTASVTFHAGAQRYALTVDRVREVQQIVSFADVDHAGLVLGVIDVRGESVPVVDVRALIGLPAVARTLDTPMIVVRGPAGAVALLVDAVDAVMTLVPEEAEPAPSLHPLASRIRAVHRVSGELVFALDVDALLGPVGPGCADDAGHEGGGRDE